jgi:hypothetical protein
VQVSQALRKPLKRTGRVSVRIAAEVHDPAGNTRTVTGHVSHVRATLTLGQGKRMVRTVADTLGPRDV